MASITEPLITAAGGIASTAVGGAFASHQQQKAFEQQVALWNMNNEYNKPINQKKRLLEAGINPYMAITGDHGSTMGNAPAPASLDTSGINQGLQGIRDYFNAEQQRDIQKDVGSAQSRKDNAEAAGIEIDNETRAAKNVADLDKVKEEAKGIKAKRFIDEYQNMLMRTVHSDVVRRYKLESDMMERDIDLKRVQYTAQDIQNRINEFRLNKLPQQFAAEMSLMAAQTWAAQQAGNLSYQQAVHEIEKIAKTKAEANGVRWDNQLKAALKPLTVCSAEFDLYQKRDEYFYNKEYDSDFADGYRQLFNTFVHPVRGIFSGSVSKSYK